MKRRWITVLLLSLVLLASCTKIEGCTTSAQPKVSSPSAFSQPKKEIKWTSLPALSMSGVSAEQKAAFLQFANEEICPCDCPQSFAGCLQDEQQCKPAIMLGQWIIDNLRANVPFDIMSEPLAKEIGMGFSARPQIIDLASYFSKGATNPSITIVEFADFECAHCKATAVALDALLKKYPQEIKLIYKHYPLTTHPMSKAAAIACEAAGLQGKFWEMHKALFTSSQPLSENQIFSIAQKIGLTGKKFAQFQTDMQSSQVIAQVENSIKEAQMLGIEGTPTLFFNGRPYFLSLDTSGLELRIQLEKMRSASKCQ